MDGIALAKDFIASPLWITTGERGQFIGLGTLYLPFPKWVSQSNAIVDRRINELSASGDVLPPVAAFTAGNDASGRKCLRAVCQHCNTSLSISDSCGPIRFSFTLQGQDGEKGLMRWPLAVGGLSMVDLIGQQARHCKNIIPFRKIQLFLCDPPRKKPPTSEPVEGFFVFKSAWLG